MCSLKEENGSREALIAYWNFKNFCNSCDTENEVDWLLGFLWIEGFKVVPHES